MDHAPYIIAVDGGGSTCRVRLADLSGRVLSAATGGPANINSDFDGALARIESTLTEAERAAGVTNRNAALAHLGLAGANISGRGPEVIEALGLVHGEVTSDRETTTQGALGNADGLVALFGTGSFFSGRVDGELRHLGGWGFILGDTGSGGWLGHRALSETIRAHDGQRPQGDLTRSLVARYGSIPDMVEFAGQATPGAFGELAPMILGAARQGDDLGLQLMEEVAAEIDSALSALRIPDTAPLVLMGGMGQAIGDLLPARHAQRAMAPKGTALDGAVDFAMQLARVSK